MIPSRSYIFNVGFVVLLLRLLYENVSIHECEQTFHFLIDRLLSRLLWKHECLSLHDSFKSTFTLFCFR